MSSLVAVEDMAHVKETLSEDKHRKTLGDSGMPLFASAPEKVALLLLKMCSLFDSCSATYLNPM